MVFCFVEFQDVSPDIIFHDLYLLMPHFFKKKKKDWIWVFKIGGFILFMKVFSLDVVGYL